MSKKVKQPEQTEQKPQESTDPVSSGIGQTFQMALNGADFKTKVLQQLVKPTAMPMLVMWWDDQMGWCSAVGNDLKVNPQVQKSVGINLFKIVANLKLFENIGIRAD